MHLCYPYVCICINFCQFLLVELCLSVYFYYILNPYVAIGGRVFYPPDALFILLL